MPIDPHGSNVPPGGEPTPPTLISFEEVNPQPPTLLLRARSGKRIDHGRTSFASNPLINGYEVIEEIGRGGMGVVYKARQVGLSRLVALKMLHAGCSEESIARFRSEAEVIARLQHPHIIQVHEVGACLAGPFVVLEYAGGGNLGARLSSTPQPATTAARVVSTLARAVQHAHERNIVHRDLKPANVLIVEESPTPLERCTFKIGDFGLARLQEGPGLTVSGQVMGTPGYMAPEQASGPGEVTPTADVYSLGVILYEMLTGRPPHRGETAIETLHLMLYSDPLPPSRLRRELPRDLETICLECLHKEPQRRYENAGALANDLDRWLSGQPVHARPMPWRERVWKLVRRHPGVTSLSALAGGLLLLAFLLVTWQWRRAEFAHSRSEEEHRRAARLAEAEAKARAEAQRLSADLLFERGVGLCEKGDLGAGLHWLVRALRTVPRENEELTRSIRLSLGGWAAQTHTLEGYHQFAHHPHAVVWEGEELFVACKNEVRFWNPQTQRETREPLTFLSPILGLLRDSEGVVAAVRETDSFALYRAPSGKRLGARLQLSSEVRAAALSPDGRFLLVGCSNNTASLYRVNSGEPVGQPWQHAGAVTACAITPDGKSAVTGDSTGEVSEWNLASGERIDTGKRHTRAVLSLTLSRDGKYILSGGEDFLLCLWKRDPGELVYARKHEHGVCSGAFHPDSSLFVTGSFDQSAQLWRTDRGVPVGAPLQHREDVLGVAFSPDGKRLATASEDGTLRVWQVRVPTVADTTLSHAGTVFAVACSPDGKGLLTSCNDGRIRLWNLATRKATDLDVCGHALAVGFHPESRLVVIGGYSGRLCVYDTTTGKVVGKPMELSAPILAAVFSPDGSRIATGCEDGDKVVRLWDWKQGVEVKQLVGHRRKVCSLAFSPDGKRLLSASWDYTARLWDLASGEAIGVPLAHQDLVKGVAFGRDGKLALTGGDDYLARLWDGATGRAWSMPLRHPDKLEAVAFSPLGQIVACGGKGMQVRLWGIDSGKPLSPPLDHEGELRGLTFEPGGKWLWTVGLDGRARRWSIGGPMKGEVEEIRTWVEVQTGKTLDDTGAMVALPLEEWKRRAAATCKR